MTEHTTHYEDCGCLSKRFAERIAELEAKVERLKTRVIAEEDDKNKRLDEMRAALAKQSLHVEDCHRQVEQAEAELAALKGRRCEGCRYWLANGCPQIGGWHPADFSCSEWQPLPETRP